MKIKFYGTRGSIPVCEKDFQKYGGNTTCLYVRMNNRIIIIDAGTGIRSLGKELIDSEDSIYNEIYLAFSHFHWDHIQGFPFFLPAYDISRKLIISALGKNVESLDLKTILGGQMKQEYFPIPMEQMGAKIEFLKVESQEYSGPDFHVKTTEHNHPGKAHSYRIESEGKSVVFCTDIEHTNGIDGRIIEIARDADILIHDAQYTPAELEDKRNWGHSSYSQAIEVAKRANVKKLILTHHDPDHNDQFLDEMEQECKDLFEDVCLARELMEFEL
ncbi:MAG: MBL fold metallo-hydrolase [Ignavibacteriae bacterium HGW-Ignavibacteriae-2]|jgi:phosphoribosyl 1,2-cyclic phosphodiesterase|nr:MBL fold metallo-hydrolase [Bacteroidota bacterium]PKL87727.1 MAG: MBL fold metallo-hydrolase [Ignavibacteriae bacterium HGW-Ignavibacteriae-2]